MRASARAPSGRFLCAWVLAVAASLLSGCSGGTRAGSTITGPVGSVGGVALTTNTGATQVQVGAQLVFTATVTNDVNNAGVTWALSGADPEHVGLGTLTNVTNTSATYTAPTGVTGATAPTITATSIANPASFASGPIVVLGTPVLSTPILFPGYVGTPYSASISVVGGVAPYTWTLASGTVPPGLVLGTTNVTSSFTTISSSTASGPTTAGTYTFQVTVTDSTGATSTATATLTINPAEACLLNGQYAILYTGFSSNQFAARASSLTVTSGGTVTGYQDFNYSAARVAEPVTGTCTTRTANDGTLTITGATSSPTYDFAVTTLTNASNGFVEGRLQVLNGGNAEAGNGLIVQQDPTAFSLTSLAGSFAFGTLGAQSSTSRMGLAGVITIDTNGNVTAGHADSNGTTPLTYAALTGTLSAPDGNGRGTLTLTGGGQTFHFSYYIVNAGRLFLIGTDAEPALAGFMTRQSTIAPGAFDSTALSNPAILSLWGAVNTTEPNTAMGLGRLSNAAPGSGTVDVSLDCAYEDVAPVLAESIPGATYTVGNDGSATLVFASKGCDGTSTSTSEPRNFALYLDGASNGYVVEHGSPVGTAGLLEFQTPGPFDNTIPGLFVSGTQYPEDVGPVLLLPQVIVAYGSVTYSASSTQNGFALDPTSGRGFGSFTAPGEAIGVVTLYPVNPNKIVMLRQGYLNRSAAIEWLISN